MTARYLLCPGTIRSRTDGQEHHVGASQLAMLYGVSRSECLIAHEPSSHFDRFAFELLMARVDSGELIALHPRADGDYKLPEPARPARPNGCYNRAPFLPIVAMPDGHSFPFRMAMDCQYTLSALGQADPRCVGCRWRANLPQTPASS